ncbi:MAG: ComEC/Rec2 family competence protein [Proteobacteria bacterium]|nr:ComEC/Rec2 family competence protein [Pseudomonadota bacterium]
MDDYFWFLGEADPVYEPLVLALRQGYLELWSDQVAALLRLRFYTWDSRWGAWFLLFAFGLKDSQACWFIPLYRKLGLLHVLVVSGSHFSFLGRWFQRLIEGPARLLYAGRFISFRIWSNLALASKFLSSVVLVFYSLLVGFNPPCQRALLALLFVIWLPMLIGPQSADRIDRWVMAAQAFCFPNSFLSLSNALSWTAYALLRRVKPWPLAWQRKFLPGIETPLVFVNLSYFGLFSPVGVFLNPLLSSVWDVLLCWGMIVPIWPNSSLASWLCLVLNRLHEGLITVMHWQDYHQGLLKLSVSVRYLQALRSGFWILGTWALLSFWKKQTKPAEACRF